MSKIVEEVMRRIRADEERERTDPEFKARRDKSREEASAGVEKAKEIMRRNGLLSDEG